MIAQIPGAEESLKAAAAQGGWLAVLVVTIFIVTTSTLALLVRTYMKQSEDREKEMRSDLRSLNQFITTELVNLVSGCKSAFAGLAKVLGERPCLHDERDRIEDMGKRPGNGL